MEKKKIVMDIPDIIHPMPRFDKIMLHIDNNFKYYLYPISGIKLDELEILYEDRAAKIKEAANSTKIVDTSFIFNHKGHVIPDSNIILFGESTENSDRVESAISKLIVSKGGALTVPSKVNLENCTMGSKIVPGVSAIKVYEYNIGLLGNPDNVIIFKERYND